MSMKTTSHVLALLAFSWVATYTVHAQALGTRPGAAAPGAAASVPLAPGARAGAVSSAAPSPSPNAANSSFPTGVNPSTSGMSPSASSVYLVGPDDVVEVRVYQEDDLLTTARVAPDGTINFPLIGSVKISGKTADNAARVVAAELAKDYLVNPQVTLKVVDYASRRFTVLGQVGKPGVYEMPTGDTITLLEAIGDAGGFTRIADLGNIRLKRLVGGKETLYKLTAKGSISTRQSSTFEIKPGDIITVGESFF